MEVLLWLPVIAATVSLGKHLDLHQNPLPLNTRILSFEITGGFGRIKM